MDKKIATNQEVTNSPPNTSNLTPKITIDEEKSLIKTIRSREEFDELLQSTKDKFIIVEFYAVWCGPCKMLTIKFQDLAEKYHDIVEVFKIDVDDLEELAIEYDVNKMPSFMIMRNGQKLEQYFGNKPEQVESMVKKYLLQS